MTDRIPTAWAEVRLRLEQAAGVVTPAIGHSWSDIAFPEKVTRWRFGAAGAEPTSEEDSYG